MERPDPADRPRPSADGPAASGRKEKLESAGKKLGTAGKKVGTAGKKVGQASKVGAAATGRVGKATGRRIRGLTGAQGARESGLSRLIELGFVNAAGDTAFAVSLAGTVFFAVPSSQARDRVALFLLLTMAPFALMAPLIGPVLDRFRHGRRWAIGATLGLRGFLVWSLAASIHDSSTWLYPAALGCLVASKAYGVTRASAVPRLLPKEITLVTANSRISLAGVAGATVGAGIAGAFAAIGPEWSLRWAAVVYTVGLVLAIRLPSRVDSPAGEEMTGTEGRDARRRAITAAVARGIRCNLGLRFVSGFLTMYLAFLLRDKPIAGIDGVVAAGAVIAAAGIGNSLGTLTGSLLKARKPEAVVLVVLLADTVVAIAVAVFYGFPLLIVLGLVAGLCSSLGKLSLDAMIQRDVPETVRTSVFARSETVLQLSWVIGGAFGIVLPLVPRFGFGFLAAVLILAVILVIRQKPTPQPPTRPRPPAAPPQPREPRPGTGTTRTVMTTESIAERRANGHRPSPTTRIDEPTVEIRLDPPSPNHSHSPDPRSSDSRPSDPRSSDRRSPDPRSSDRRSPDPRSSDPRSSDHARAPEHPRSADHPRSGAARPAAPPTVGRWWSGQPAEDDETTVDEAPWASEPTLETKPPEALRRKNPFRRTR